MRAPIDSNWSGKKNNKKKLSTRRFMFISLLSTLLFFNRGIIFSLRGSRDKYINARTLGTKVRFLFFRSYVICDFYHFGNKTRFFIWDFYLGISYKQVELYLSLILCDFYSWKIRIDDRLIDKSEASRCRFIFSRNAKVKNLPKK